jgi:3-hydroxy-D-aspartate aldolase
MSPKTEFADFEVGYDIPLDDLANVAELSRAAQKHGTTLECLVEIDCGAGRCGVGTITATTEIAKAIDAASALRFAGIQAYQGATQHLEDYQDRKAKLDHAIALVKASSRLCGWPA